MGRALLSVAIVLIIVLGPLVWFLVRSTNKDERTKNRSAMMSDENYLAIEQATNLLSRIIEQDDIFPAMQTKHRNEAEEIIADFHKRQLRKGK